MNIQEAKQIKIADYLLSLGHHPVKQQGANLWYKSPLRNESEPSFKVNTTMNSWFDFGMGKGIAEPSWRICCPSGKHQCAVSVFCTQSFGKIKLFPAFLPKQIL